MMVASTIFYEGWASKPPWPEQLNRFILSQHRNHLRRIVRNMIKKKVRLIIRRDGTTILMADSPGRIDSIGRNQGPELCHLRHRHKQDISQLFATM